MVDNNHVLSYATQYGVYFSSWLSIAPVQLSRSRRSGHDQMYQVP